MINCCTFGIRVEPPTSTILGQNPVVADGKPLGKAMGKKPCETNGVGVPQALMKKTFYNLVN